VKLGEYQLQTSQSGAKLDIDRHTAAVVAHLHAAIGMDLDRNVRTVSTHRLID
jgi:hypothetical protein